MKIRLLRTENDYEEALKRIDDLINCKENSDEEEELALISLLVWDYEEQYYPIGKLLPIQAIKTRMEELELQPKDLSPIIGDKSRVSEILSMKRKLTLRMIRNLNKALDIPIETLVQEY